MNNSDKEIVKKYYDQEAADYIHMYEKDYLSYPANAIRLEMVLKRLKQNNVKTLLDVGCGTCGPMIRFLKEGISCKGFDFSREMVDTGKKELEKYGYSKELISVNDLETGTELLNEKFDAAIALGVFPHILDEKKALLQMKNSIKTSGKVYIEFRNELFSAYTLNKYSVEFFLNNVLSIDKFSDDLKEKVIDFYTSKMDANKQFKKENNKIHYTDILAKFKNPLVVTKELFEPCGLAVDEILFYHYHALPPIFENKHPELFKKLSLEIEDPLNWRGYLMASAFVVEATKLS